MSFGRLGLRAQFGRPGSHDVVGGGGGGDVTAPTITSANSASVDENAALSHSLTADEAVTWSIVGGVDQAQFEISGSTLRWASNGTQDYEDPQDTGANNTYVVDVRATDAASNTSDQTITITVVNVDDSVNWVTGGVFPSYPRVEGPREFISLGGMVGG